MYFIETPAYIICILLLLIVFSEWLAQKKYFKHAGAVILVILLAAILANLNVIPSSHNAPPLYDQIFKYAAPLGIFFLLLEVKLRDLRFAGAPMMIMFLLGSLATMIGVVLSYWLLSPQDHHINQAYAVGGMYTGTYIGGSANLNAIAINYGVNKDGTLFAAINAADNIITTPWMLVTILLPPIMQKFFPRKKNIPPGMQTLTEQEVKAIVSGDNTGINLTHISLLLALGFGVLFISSVISTNFPKIPSILVLTTLALLLAQIPFIQKLKGGKMIGMLLIMLFLAVIGAFCDIQALVHSGEAAGILLIWVTLIVLIHGIIIFGIGGLFKQDWDIVSIASNANIGGATSAPVCAASLGRTDLQLPGLLAGSVGNAIGTYLGIFIAEFLK